MLMPEALNFFQMQAWLIARARAAMLARVFDLIAPARPSPVILSVPHAGRLWSARMAALLRVAPDRLLPLEDRYADLIAGDAAKSGAAVIVARMPRGWIDLNRAEQDIDATMIDPPGERGRTPSLKVRGGLGLIPRRLAGVGDIWRGGITRDDLDQRIATVHRPYHEAIQAMIGERRRAFGCAVLIDLHSMPPLVGSDARIVIGDRFGRTAAGRFSARLRAECEAAGLTVAENSPYAGGHLIERHGDPRDGVHALQIEVDRSLYLKPGLVDPDRDAVARLRAMIARACLALADEAGGPLSIAAE